MRIATLMSFIRVCANMAREPGSDVRLPSLMFKSATYHVQSRRIYADRMASIRGVRNIETTGTLFVGTAYVGFMNRYERTFLNIRGALVIDGTVQIGKGCRFDIGPGATCRLDGCWITGQTNAIIAHSLEIGRGCSISWGCQFLDDDWHHVDYAGKKDRPHGIRLGSHVWVGNGATILKGVAIGDNSVVAANAVVTRSFPETGVLIAGNPADIIRRDVNWT